MKNLYISWKSRKIFILITIAVICLVASGFICYPIYKNETSHVNAKVILEKAIIITITLIIIILITSIQNIKKYQKEQTYKALQSYIHNYNPNIILYINESLIGFNAMASSNIAIGISKKWYKYAINNGYRLINITLGHELYHINQNHPYFCKEYLQKYMFWNPTLRNKYYCKLWLEELMADRYGLEITGDKGAVLEKMENMFNNSHKIRIKDDHPPKSIRMKYIDGNIKPTLENVTEEFNKYYKIKKIWEKK